MKIAIQNAKIVAYTDKSEVIENHTLIVEDDLISDIIPDSENLSPAYLVFENY